MIVKQNKDFLKWTTASLKLAAVILIDQAIVIDHTLCDK